MPLSLSHRNANDPSEAGRWQEELELMPQSPEPEGHLAGRSVCDPRKGRKDPTGAIQLKCRGHPEEPQVKGNVRDQDPPSLPYFVILLPQLPLYRDTSNPYMTEGQGGKDVGERCRWCAREALFCAAGFWERRHRKGRGDGSVLREKSWAASTMGK